MISTILKSGETTRFALDYNERKVDAGVAAVIGVRNMPGDDAYTIRTTLMGLEENAAISVKARHLAYHMSVSPGEEDKVEEASVMRYIDSVMEGMGYAEQPYAIYRHNDIDREHYHVVSVKAGKNGHIIGSRNDRYRLMKLQETYSKIFGFHHGLPPEARKKDAPAKGGGLMQGLRADIMDALDNYDWDNILEARLILKEHGIEMRRKYGKDNRPLMSFRYKAADGSVTSRVYSAKSLFPDTVLEDILQKKKAECTERRRTGSGAERAAVAARFCEKRTSTVEEFQGAMAQVGFSSVFLDKSGRETEKEDEIAVVVITDIENRSLFVLHEVERQVAEALKKKPFKRKPAKRNPLSRQDVEILQQRLPQAGDTKRRKSTNH